jgi:PKHD-type hydroxylase
MTTPQQQVHSTLTYAAWANAFSAEEADRIERYGDGLALSKAALQGTSDSETPGSIRVTRTAWIEENPETRWLYKRVQDIAMALNNMAYKFDLRGFAERFQYSVYHDSDGGHYNWHVDQGPLAVRRKLSLTLQLTDPASYEGGELQMHAGNLIETAPRDRGMLIAFPAYVLHRVTPVISGTRKSVVIWTTGPQFQ